MKIVNETRFDSRDLRSLFIGAINRYSWQDSSAQVKREYKRRLNIRVANTRHSTDCCTGYAFYNSYRMTIRLPHKITLADVAAVFTHELMHCLGLKHQEMPSRKTLTEEAQKWVTSYTVKEKPTKIKVKRDVVSDRFTHAIKMLTKHTRILKREQLAVKKWNKKVKYYQSKQAAQIAQCEPDDATKEAFALGEEGKQASYLDEMTHEERRAEQ